MTYKTTALKSIFAAALTVVALPAFAATINVGTGKREFIADQQLKYPHTQQAMVETTTIQRTVNVQTIEPAGGPKGNSMQPVNSEAKPAMMDADADANPLPAIK